MHPFGKKKDYKWRLETPERAAKAGFRKIGMGALLGLSDWRYEAAMLSLHIDYLQKHYWKDEITLGFPRINPPTKSFNTPYPVTNKNLVQMLCALRIYLPDVAFLLSTRESPEFRDNLIGLCITQISAGSKTNPGGYLSNDSDEQFSVSDHRNLSEMIKTVKQKGYEAVLKDWEPNFLGIKK
jgi:2-iminoacetate synthase